MKWSQLEPYSELLHPTLLAMNNKLILMGGGNQSISSQISLYSLEKWSVLDCEVSCLQAAVCVAHDLIYIFGGIIDPKHNNLISVSNQFLCLDPDRKTVSNVHFKGTGPSKRFGACMVYHNQKLFLFGGVVDDKTSNELWVFDFSSNRWDSRFSDGSCFGRFSHSMCISDDKIIVYGGLGIFNGKLTKRDDIGILNISTRRWFFPYRPKGSNWPPRYMHAACIVHSEMFVFGGMSVDGIERDIFAIDLNTFKYRLVTTFPFPRAGFAFLRLGLSVDVMENKIFVYGGMLEDKRICGDFDSYSIVDDVKSDKLEKSPASFQQGSRVRDSTFTTPSRSRLESGPDVMVSASPIIFTRTSKTSLKVEWNMMSGFESRVTYKLHMSTGPWLPLYQGPLNHYVIDFEKEKGFLGRRIEFSISLVDPTDTQFARKVKYTYGSINWSLTNRCWTRPSYLQYFIENGKISLYYSGDFRDLWYRVKQDDESTKWNPVNVSESEFTRAHVDSSDDPSRLFLNQKHIPLIVEAPRFIQFRNYKEDGHWLDCVDLSRVTADSPEEVEELEEQGVVAQNDSFISIETELSNQDSLISHQAEMVSAASNEIDEPLQSSDLHDVLNYNGEEKTSSAGEVVSGKNTESGEIITEQVMEISAGESVQLGNDEQIEMEHEECKDVVNLSNASVDDCDLSGLEASRIEAFKIEADIEILEEPSPSNALTSKFSPSVDLQSSPERPKVSPYSPVQGEIVEGVEQETEKVVHKVIIDRSLSVISSDLRSAPSTTATKVCLERSYPASASVQSSGKQIAYKYRRPKHLDHYYSNVGSSRSSEKVAEESASPVELMEKSQSVPETPMKRKPGRPRTSESAAKKIKVDNGESDAMRAASPSLIREEDDVSQLTTPQKTTGRKVGRPRKEVRQVGSSDADSSPLQQPPGSFSIDHQMIGNPESPFFYKLGFADKFDVFVDGDWRTGRVHYYAPTENSTWGLMYSIDGWDICYTSLVDLSREDILSIVKPFDASADRGKSDSVLVLREKFLGNLKRTEKLPKKGTLFIRNSTEW